MKFTIQRQEFMEQLADVTRAIPVKAPVPVLTGIKIEVNEEGLTLIGSDVEISIESFISIEEEQYALAIDKIGSIVVPARLFTDIVRKLPAEEVTIESNEHFLLTITSGQATFNLNGLDGSSYPHLPEIESTQQIELPTVLFKGMINQTIFSASNQESRPMLTGLHLIAGEGTITAVATDSYRLSRRVIPVRYSLKQMNFKSMTIPKKTVTELSRIVDDQQQLFMIAADKQVIFIVDNLVIYSRLLEGVFPDANRLIPSDYQTEIVVDSLQFMAAIDRASLMSHQGKNNVVQLTIQNNQVELSVLFNERGQVSEQIDTKLISGDGIKISFNPDYMKDALRSFGGTDIKLYFQTAMRPILITSDQEEVSEDNHLLQILTPIRTHY